MRLIFKRLSAGLLGLALLLLCACGAGAPAPTPSSPARPPAPAPTPVEEVLPYTLGAHYRSILGFAFDYDSRYYELRGHADGKALWGDQLLYLSFSSINASLAEVTYGLMLQNEAQAPFLDMTIGTGQYPCRMLDLSTDKLLRRFYVADLEEYILLVEQSCPLDRDDTALHLELQPAILDTLTLSKPDPTQLLRVYADALDRFRTQHILPDGQPSGFDPDGTFGAMEENRFAVFDVDGDGQKELLLEYHTSIMAGMSLFIYDYFTGDPDVLRLHAQFFPGSSFYPNGTVKAIASHNQTHSDFWPFALHQYDTVTGQYTDIAYVYACERTVHPDNFPNQADPDGEGIVFYLQAYDPAEGTYLPEKAISRAEYETWFASRVGNSKPLDIQYRPLTAENIDELRQ